MNKEKYTLQEVTTPALEREWLDFPKRIYKGNRNWVCPLDVDVLEVFNPSKNELFADGEAIRWVARDARGELVGRIAAFYNREKASIEEQPTGGCGFFESIDDQQVADMLFEASRMWLASRGMEAMDGPINFGRGATGGGCWSRATNSSPSTRIPTIRPITRSCSKTMVLRITSISTVLSGG